MVNYKLIEDNHKVSNLLLFNGGKTLDFIFPTCSEHWTNTWPYSNVLVSSTTPIKFLPYLGGIAILALCFKFPKNKTKNMHTFE